MWTDYKPFGVATGYVVFHIVVAGILSGDYPVHADTICGIPTSTVKWTYGSK